jgi:hypothetical protein
MSSQSAVNNFDDLYLPDHYTIVRINPIPGLEKRSSWWTYDTKLACEIDRIHGRFAKKLLKTGYIEFLCEQEHFHRTVFVKRKIKFKEKQ